ncbi:MULTISPECIES: tetraprenyl-beta-curcumene synthase family protein [Cytobacillus]|uniref:tetraprenyl-beta-curcumene synthase family protein n=1 Tax=Cytobacillus TaxID=2675230 RepID=UPI00203BC0AC|nr:tetraprenyl-beta-curcumene synthase family protein [Cytobacillus kochii]MCM3322962.1 tetraprenyl-beta-curcumene synthase family protein [Cytobacillus kochii]MCM3345358.1 tetraprenyl-beta-curcumene synthase family protein [Cytobacillus kochii]MDM5208904.1 tetraprenyl-beta-curcumene synthase family protein [Cytobacillus kochii]
MNVPTMPISLMTNAYKKVMPAVNEELNKWRKLAESIPNDELKSQALSSIKDKTFHCEGGAIMSLLAVDDYRQVITFIVAYQTISDYLDNLCDRSTSMDPKDFTAIHEAMRHSLLIDEQLPKVNYYRYRDDQDDGGYLLALVMTCRKVLSSMENYPLIKSYLTELCRYYCDLQIHKHVAIEERVSRLQSWYKEHQDLIPPMSWYEFSACSGSTLGIFCLVAYATRRDYKESYGEIIRNGYFPYIQGLHILLDYYIDQEEDKEAGDLNFCFYYEDEKELFERIRYFVKCADEHTDKLPHKRFHLLINRGLLGLYLSDEKVGRRQQMKKLARKMIKSGGFSSLFFYINGRAYRALKSRQAVVRS